MKNIAGALVEGGNFFPRDRDLRRFQSRLDAGDHVLLLGPRRTGKSSFVIRLCQELRQNGWKAIELNVEGCDNELDFIERLLDGLKEAGIELNLTGSWLSRLKSVKRELGGKFKFGGWLEIDLTDTEKNSEPLNLRDSIETIFKRIDDGSQSVLIAIDEFPELLLNIEKAHGPERLAPLLHWMRSMRQTFRKQLRWIVFGSIGLDSFVERHNITKTINDLAVLSLEPMTVDEAMRFLDRLGNGAQRTLTSEVGQAILDEVGSPIHYFLQLIVHELFNLNADVIDVAHVALAIENILRPDRFANFDTWQERLEVQFQGEELAIVIEILNQVCMIPQGESRQSIHDGLMTKRQNANANEVERKMRHLLLVLQRDGYLVANEGRYSFLSFLLRRFWKRKNVD